MNKTETEILDLIMYSNDLHKEVTIREYLQRLLLALFEEGEGFNGKRPLGNSGWEDDIILCLLKNGVIDGIVEDGSIEDYDYTEYEYIIKRCIRAL